MQFLYTNFFQLALALMVLIFIAVLWAVKEIKSSHKSLIGSIIGSRSMMERFEDKMIAMLKEAYDTHVGKADLLLRQLESMKELDKLTSYAIQNDNAALKTMIGSLQEMIVELTGRLNELQQLEANKPTTSELVPLTSEEFKEVMRNFQQLVQKVQAELTISFEKLDRSVAQSFIAGLGKK